jgi:hypothetical protein
VPTGWLQSLGNCIPRFNLAIVTCRIPNKKPLTPVG